MGDVRPFVRKQAATPLSRDPDERKPGDPDYPHMRGEAFCLGCGHTFWAEREVGPDSIRFECPACSAAKCYFKYEAALPPDTLVATCVCGTQLFYMTQEGHLCPNCGEYRRY